MITYIIKAVARPFLGAEAQCLSDRILNLHHEIESGVRASPSLIAQKMLVSAEDHRAANHPGYDLVSIFRAIYKFFLNGRREGGSTIAQQLVRVLSGRYELSFNRKFKEIALACLVSETVPRRFFPPVYLSVAYYGTGIVGYAAACRVLGISNAKCDEEGAAKVVARLKYPQPLVSSLEMRSKVSKREAHIIELYLRHEGIGVYEYLDAVFSVDSSVAHNGASSLR